MYKKKTLKFTNDNIRRNTRVAETLKARESSRFKRLSMIRSINNSDMFNEKSLETVKLAESEVTQNIKKQPMSRLEMLHKWKQEKQVKREIEMKIKKKPFYVGGGTIAKPGLDNKNLQNTSSVIAPLNTTCNTSKIIKSKLFAPSSSLQSNKVSNTTKQFAPSSSLQSNKVANTTKQFTSGTSQLSKIPGTSKQISSVPKSFTPLNKGHNAATTPKKPTNQIGSHLASYMNQNRPIPKVVNNNHKTLSTPGSTKVTKVNNSVKPVNQVYSQPKPLSRIPSKPIQMVRTALPKPVTPASIKPAFQKVQSKAGLIKGKPMPNAASISNKIPAQNKIMDNSAQNGLRKGYCFKKAAVASSNKQQIGILKKVSTHNVKKADEKAKKDVEVKGTGAKSLSKHSSDCVQDVTFNSNISVIKCPSFAPDGFQFQPPTDLTGFIFEDDDDPYEALENIKLKFMSRTSTPTKSAEGSPKEPEDHPSDDINADTKKSFDASTFNTMEASDLISPKSSLKEKSIVNEEFNDELVDEKPFKGSGYDAATKKNSDEVCDKILKSSFSEKDLLCDSVKIGDMAESQAIMSVKDESFQNISKENMSFNDSLLDDALDVNNVKDIVTEQIQLIKLEDEEADRGKNELMLKSSFSEKELLCDSDKIGDMTENQAIMSVKDGSFQNISKENMSFKDCLLEDALDLNKMKDIVTEQIQLLKLEDEELDKVDIPEELEVVKHVEKKPLGAIPKRVSVLKSTSVLNVISEADECSSETAAKSRKENQDIMVTPRRSKRISNQKLVDSESSVLGTPRRSLRLQKSSSKQIEFGNSVLSPFEEIKSNFNKTPRRSMRLIDLNTPKTEENDQKSKSSLKAGFGKMKDSENVDPSEFLINFESPDPVPKSKFKKVSLLYSPDKRKSLRKSIRGDLMVFSPSS